ncbi:MAG: DUF86 domain-containing protein [Deltaproteobacteria bacterium]|nr:DUF86 domain-containing protein [Deltaproteobacteria bacterium]
MRRDDATLLDLLKAARLALQFKGDATRQEFLDDDKTQSAVLHQLLLLGEGAKRLSEQFRDKHPGMPWKHIAGMRDKLIHEYDTVDIEEVWSTIERDVPALLAFLDAIAPVQK